MSTIVFRREMSPPSTVVSIGGKVRVAALLFRAGDYPDKGVSVTEQDLRDLVATFHATGCAAVPVKAEHIDSPLDPLGHLMALHLDGPELFGTLVFSDGVYSHLEERGVKHVSIALLRQPETEAVRFALKEVSVVAEPRVPGAGFLSGAQLEAALAKFTAAGKLTPAMVPHARILLTAPSAVTFSDGSTGDVGAAAMALLEALPVVQPRGAADAVPALAFGRPQTAPKGSDLSPEIQRMVKSLGGDPDKIAATLAATGGSR